MSAVSPEEAAELQAAYAAARVAYRAEVPSLLMPFPERAVA